MKTSCSAMNGSAMLRVSGVAKHSLPASFLFAAVVLVLCVPSISVAEPGEAGSPIEESQSPAGAKTADEIAKELANPNNSLASLTFKNQFRWYEGTLPMSSEQFNYTMLFQPVFPFSLGETSDGGKANLFVRPAFPLLFDQPIPHVGAGGFEFDNITALGDIGFDVAYGVTSPEGEISAVGMVGTLPTATSSSVAGKQLRLGPEVLFAKASSKGIVGIFPSHQWDVAGWGGGEFSTTTIQPFFRVLPGGGWSVGSVPIMSYNWESEEWAIPINFVASKTIQPGKTPLKVELEINYYVTQDSAFGQEWMIGFNITPVVPNFIEQAIRN